MNLAGTKNVRVAWWLKPYLYGLAIVSAVTGCEPDFIKVKVWIDKAVTAKKRHPVTCALFGHRWLTEYDEDQTDISVAKYCHCGAHMAAPQWLWMGVDYSKPVTIDEAWETWPGKAEGKPRPSIIWSNELPKPTRPAPPMPESKLPSQENSMNDINAALGELLDAKRALEVRLQKLISAEMSDFRMLTGVSVSALDVEFFDMTTMSDERRQFMVSLVKAQIEVGQ